MDPGDLAHSQSHVFIQIKLLVQVNHMYMVYFEFKAHRHNIMGAMMDSNVLADLHFST